MPLNRTSIAYDISCDKEGCVNVAHAEIPVVKDKENRIQAEKHFIYLGWRILRGHCICPDCLEEEGYKKRRS